MSMPFTVILKFLLYMWQNRFGQETKNVVGKSMQTDKNWDYGKIGHIKTENKKLN